MYWLALKGSELRLIMEALKESQTNGNTARDLSIEHLRTAIIEQAMRSGDDE